MKEYKVVNVNTSSQQYWINFYGDFGWELSASQDVKTQTQTFKLLAIQFTQLKQQKNTQN